jgi:3-dehydroquinate synthase
MLVNICRKHLRTAVLMQQGALEAVDWADELKASTNHFLLADSHVMALHGQCVQDALSRCGARLRLITVEPGESTKSVEVYLRVTKEISSIGVERNSTLISFGGAVTANLAGFVAATLLRGIRLIHIPTTLLAQLDGTVDFKQAINLDGVKNLIGSFYAPVLIVLDPRFLATLPERHVVNGFAEGLKHSLCQDAALYERFLERATDRSDGFLEESVQRTVSLKIRLLESPVYDEAEMLLQYGHAVGHALESVTHNELLHGEAIAIGMCVSAELSLALGLCSADTVDAHYRLFEAYGLPTHIPAGCSIDEVLRLIYRDKYRTDGMQQMALIREIGVPVSIDGSLAISVAEDDLRQACLRNIESEVYVRSAVSA